MSTAIARLTERCSVIVLLARSIEEFTAGWARSESHTARAMNGR